MNPINKTEHRAKLKYANFKWWIRGVVEVGVFFAD